MPISRRPAAERTRIRVVVRIRPTIAEDVKTCTAEQYYECVNEDATRGTVQLRRPFFDTRQFSMDMVLNRDATQAQAYEAIGRPVVDDVLQGLNGTVLAYGQTGTGKTYTIYGPLSYWRRAPVGCGVGGGVGRVAPSQTAPPLPLQPHLELSGIIPRAAMQIFAHIDDLRERGDKTEVKVLISSLQIWNEAISDLLGERRRSGPLTLREDPVRGVYADGLVEHEVHGADGILALVHESATNRATCATSMNRSSSRSHALLLIRVEQRTPPPDDDDDITGGDDVTRTNLKQPALGGVVRRGLLSIIDLAGSERVCKSGSDGARLAEAKRINKSIAALGNCIAALASVDRGQRAAGSVHVPYRDSKLTRLLTDSLGGNTKTTLCASVGPSLSHYDESFCTLLLATRAMAVKSHVRINETAEGYGRHDSSPRTIALLTQVRELQSEVQRLRRESAARPAHPSQTPQPPPDTYRMRHDSAARPPFPSPPPPPDVTRIQYGYETAPRQAFPSPPPPPDVYRSGAYHPSEARMPFPSPPPAPKTPTTSMPAHVAYAYSGIVDDAPPKPRSCACGHANGLADGHASAPQSARRATDAATPSSTTLAGLASLQLGPPSGGVSAQAAAVGCTSALLAAARMHVLPLPNLAGADVETPNGRPAVPPGAVEAWPEMPAEWPAPGRVAEAWEQVVWNLEVRGTLADRAETTISR